MAPLFGLAKPLWTRLFPKATANMPDLGPRGLNVVFPMATNTEYEINIPLTTTGLGFINGVFVDNSDNSSGFVLYNPDTRQKIFVPANSQAMLALITSKTTDNVTFRGLSTGGVDVPVIFRNTEPVSDTIYSTVAAGQIIGAVTVQGQVTALSYVSAGIDAAAQSITVGGAAQTLFAANAARKGLLIANPASGPSQGLGAVQPESLFIKFGGTPAIAGDPGTIEIAPGGFFNPLTAIDTRAISIIAATTGHDFAAIQYQ